MKRCLIFSPAPITVKQYLIDKQTLEELYLNQHLSQPQIARLYNVTQGAVQYWTKQYGIPVRSHSEIMHAWIKKKGYDIPENNPNWKGGRHADGKGYIHVLKKGHPHSSHGYVREHILVWEQVHNKPLPDGWAIHHLNGIPSDNRPENLVAMPAHRHDHYIPALKKRIRELEIRNSQLERSLQEGQFMLRIGGEN